MENALYKTGSLCCHLNAPKIRASLVELHVLLFCYPNDIDGRIYKEAYQDLFLSVIDIKMGVNGCFSVFLCFILPCVLYASRYSEQVNVKKPVANATLKKPFRINRLNAIWHKASKVSLYTSIYGHLVTTATRNQQLVPHNS